MATEKQIEANRLNAQKSTGPKTGYPLGPGEANVRLNTLRHGMRARAVVLPNKNEELLQQLLRRTAGRMAAPNAHRNGFARKNGASVFRHGGVLFGRDRSCCADLSLDIYMHVMRLLAMALLVSCCAYCQCTLWNQATCASVYSGSPNPSLSTFLADVEASFQAIDAATASMPQPKIALTAQILPAGWLNSSVQTFGPAINGYMDLLKTKAGVTTQDVNMWPSVLSSASQYSPGSGDITITSDCAGGATIGKGASVPAGTGPATRCKALTYYDSMFSHAAANGITMRVGFYPPTETITACGLSPAPGTFTESQYEHCLIPLIKAAMSRWTTAITAVQVFEEPLGGMASVQVFSIADVGTFLQNSSAAVKAIAPGALVGAAATGISWPTSLDTGYWTDWTTGNVSGAGTPAALDFLVIDLFSGKCDQSGNDYYNVTQWFKAHYLGANAGGKPVRVGQSDHPIWCHIGGLADQPNAYLGAGDVIWQTSGMETAWQSTIVKWASTAGIQSYAVFCTLPFFNYTSNQSNDNCVVGTYSALAMSQLSPTDAAAGYQTLGHWPVESIQGNAHLAGRASLGH